MAETEMSASQDRDIDSQQPRRDIGMSQYWDNNTAITTILIIFNAQDRSITEKIENSYTLLKNQISTLPEKHAKKLHILSHQVASFKRCHIKAPTTSSNNWYLSSQSPKIYHYTTLSLIITSISWSELQEIFFKNTAQIVFNKFVFSDDMWKQKR